MTYQVLARKWRPRTFEQMAGQEHVLRALSNGLSDGRIHHAYLFTGTRGVGKTTVARILAKCLNCEAAGITATPCGHCDACREIDEGRFVDLIEVDAASRTKVEDTRELLDNVQYAPTRGRFKIYLIDEVHMLSGHSFNALLKTLEEPPDHVKFLLATTDPQKLPVTVLSRCLQFNLKHLGAALMGTRLAAVLEAEGIEAEAGAIEHIARAAEGSMRDALSLTDQAVAFCGGAVSEEAVRDMLGTIDRGFVFDLIEAAAAGDGERLLATVGRMAERACDYGDVLAELLSVLHRVALAQAVPSTRDADAADDRLRALADTLSEPETQLFYQIALTGRRDLPLAPDPRTGFEMVLLRLMAFRPGDTDELDGTPRTPTAERAAPQPSEPPRGTAPTTDDSSRPAPPLQPERSVAATGAPAEPANWQAIVAALPLSGMARALAEHCFLQERGSEHLRLGIDTGHQHLVNPGMQTRIQDALSAHLGGTIRVTIDVVADSGEETPAEANAQATAERQAAAVRAIDEDPHVAALKDAFDARVSKDSIRPRSDG